MALEQLAITMLLVRDNKVKHDLEKGNVADNDEDEESNYNNREFFDTQNDAKEEVSKVITENNNNIQKKILKNLTFELMEYQNHVVEHDRFEEKLLTKAFSTGLKASKTARIFQNKMSKIVTIDNNNFNTALNNEANKDNKSYDNNNNNCVNDSFDNNNSINSNNDNNIIDNKNDDNINNSVYDYNINNNNNNNIA
jgi:hypothetical protein